jgi:hypothetical protein
MAAKSKKGMGFKAAQKQIAAKQGISQDRAGAILASSTRKASPAAKKRNPNLKKVPTAKKGKK